MTSVIVSSSNKVCRGPKPKNFSRNLLKQTGTLRPGKNDILFRKNLFKQILDRAANLVRFGRIHGWINFSKQLILNTSL